jgi:hypothetical protein
MPAFIKNAVRGPGIWLMTAAALWGWAIDSSFTNDELSALVRLRYDDMGALMEKGVKPDGHPAGVQTFLWLWTKIVPQTEFWVRWPFFMCSMGALWLLYRMSGTAAAATLLFSVPLVIPLIAARPYAPGLLFVIWTAHNLQRQKSASATMAAAAYCHHFAALQVGVMYLWTAAQSPKKKKMLMDGGIALLLYLPHIRLTWTQLNHGGLAWLSPPDAHFLTEWLRRTFNESYVLAALATALSLGAAIRDKQTRKYLAWFGIPLAAMYGYSRFSAPVLHYYGPFFAAPFLFMALSGGLRGGMKEWYWAGAMAVTGVFAFESAPWGRFRELHAAAVEWKGAALFASVNHPEYVYHYGRETTIVANACRDSVEQWMRAVAESKAKRAAWIHAGCDEAEYPEWIRRFYPCLTEARTWPGAGAYLFEKEACAGYEYTHVLNFRPALILDATNPYSPGWDSLPCGRGKTVAVWAEAAHCGGVVVLEGKNWHGSKYCLDTLEFIVRTADEPKVKAYFWNPDTTPITLKRLGCVCR